MPKPNPSFDLSIRDIDLIEAALHTVIRDLSIDRIENPELPADADADPLRQIHDLLGRLHNQKTFFRPGADTYIGG
ncbi:hypothetical protein R5H30_16755 [Sulfitobacter sp. D35]|uniref:hypothetical protein n=1 Tax=Sulfitobacter sp. D35 TaxID=3083252 RepID=UPI00296F54B1|nr:hypothetical protein [Sulfitobacter sp. D35]MDW4499646.1 hypothetical protein [Sulfitobacter sp. D35]